MSSASATACTCNPGRWLNCTAARLNSTPYRWVFFGPARDIRHLLWLAGSVYIIEGRSPISCIALLAGDSIIGTPPTNIVPEQSQKGPSQFPHRKHRGCRESL